MLLLLLLLTVSSDTNILLETFNVTSPVLNLIEIVRQFWAWHRRSYGGDKYNVFIKRLFYLFYVKNTHEETGRIMSPGRESNWRFKIY